MDLGQCRMVKSVCQRPNPTTLSEQIGLSRTFNALEFCSTSYVLHLFSDTKACLLCWKEEQAWEDFRPEIVLFHFSRLWWDMCTKSTLKLPKNDTNTAQYFNFWISEDENMEDTVSFTLSILPKCRVIFFIYNNDEPLRAACSDRRQK